MLRRIAGLRLQPTMNAERHVMALVLVCAITCDCYPGDVLVRRTAEAAASAGYEYHVICSMREG